MNQSKIFFWCTCMEVMLIFCMICAPITGQIAIWLPSGNLSFGEAGILNKDCGATITCLENDLTVTISTLTRDLIISSIFWQLYSVFKNIRTGKIFSHIQISRIYKTGWLFIILSAYSFLNDFYIHLIKSNSNNPLFFFQLDNAEYIPIGAGLVILGYVWSLAIKIKEENDLVI